MRILPVAFLVLLAACNDRSDTAPDDSIPGEYYDNDADGYDERTDCDDDDPSIHPGADEVCDSLDNDCDGLVDDEDADLTDGSTWYVDNDADGYGSDESTLEACEQPDGWVDHGGDCNDGDARYHPGADESDCADPNDYNCDGKVGYTDTDGDGFAACEECDDTDAEVYPEAIEFCNGYDDDCDAEIDESDAADAPTWYADLDDDGYGDPDNTTTACEQPDGYVGDNTDCDDANPLANPMGTEVCDDADNDCDGSVDEDATDAATWFLDADGDTYGIGSSAIEACDRPPGYSATPDDCNDDDATIHPDADEECNGVDDDCDGTVDDEAIDGAWYYADDDDDSFGDALDLTWACSGAENDWDCNDADAGEPQVVDVSAAATSSDGTAAHPWTTIQEGIDTAAECVVVHNGTYHENIDFGGKGVSVTGVDGKDATVIQGESSDAAVVTFATGEGADAELSGFTLTDGGGYAEYFEDSSTCGSASWTCYTYTWTWCGGGIFVDGATPTLHDLTLTENALPEASSWTSGIVYTYYEYSYGGGLCARDTTLTLEEVDLSGNYADQGGGAWIDEDSVVTWTQSTIQGNTASDGAAFEVDGGRLTLTNVLSAWNTASDNGGGALVIDGLLTEVNVTHGGDDAAIGGGLYLHGTSTGSVMNTIIYGAATGEGVYGDSTATFSGLYNDVYGNAGGEYSGVTNPTGTYGNISWDPSFTDVTDDGDPTDDDWTLASTSVCVDAGNSSSAYNDADGTRNDMGAYGGPGGVW
jgi:hypothetical protein